MIKHPFTNLGVAQMQASILAMNPVDMAIQISLIRTNFDDWLNNNFELSSSQITQLHALPTTFKHTMSTQLADVWENGGMVSFFKGEDDEEKPPRDRDKDILLLPVNKMVYSFDNDSTIITTELSIWIT